MTKFEIKKGWMNTVWRLDDGIVLTMTVKDLKEIISEVTESTESLS